MAEILRPDANVPLELRLRFATGKQVEGQFGPQTMFTVEDKSGGVRTIYLDPVVSTQIDSLDLAVGEPFMLCKRQTVNGGRKSTKWEVARLTDRPGQQPITRVAQQAYAPVGPAEVPAPAPAPQVMTPRQDGTATLMAECLRQAVDLLASTQKYASERGFPLVTFSAEDIRTTAASLFIARDREQARLRGAA